MEKSERARCDAQVLSISMRAARPIRSPSILAKKWTQSEKGERLGPPAGLCGQKKGRLREERNRPGLGQVLSQG